MNSLYTPVKLVRVPEFERRRETDNPYEPVGLKRISSGFKIERFERTSGLDKFMEDRK